MILKPVLANYLHVEAEGQKPAKVAEMKVTCEPISSYKLSVTKHVWIYSHIFEQRRMRIVGG